MSQTQNQEIVIACSEYEEDCTVRTTLTLIDRDDHFFIREVVEPVCQEDEWLVDTSETEREVNSQEAIDFAVAAGLSFEEAAQAVMLGPDLEI